SSGTSSAPASTIVRASRVPTTTRSSVDSSSCWGSVGLTTSSPSMRPMRTAPTGPRNGSGEIARAAEAPLMQSTSCGTTRSAGSTVQITCTSLRKPFGHNGRIGRSIMRAVSVARSVARPSRLKKPPGIFPAAYIRSSTSTVSGKKSASGRVSARPTAVARIIVSPLRTTTAPSACFASLPVSKRSSRPPTSTDTVAYRPVAMLIWSIPSRFRVPEGGGLSQPRRCRAGLGQTSTFRRWRSCLPAQAELLDQGTVALQVGLLQVRQEPAPAADELQEAAARVVVLGVRAQVLRELADPLRQHRDLHLGRPRVLGAAPVLSDQLLLRFLRQSHSLLLVDVSAVP